MKNKIKCAILTFHRAHNYGAVLQVYALQRIVERLGCDVDVLDYHCKFIENHYKFPKPWRIVGLKRLISILLHNGDIYSSSDNFNQFRNKYLKISNKQYFGYDDLKEADRIYDKFIVGSDQVWSPFAAGFDKSYFLNFVSENKKKFAYSASFGVEVIPAKFIDGYKELLSKFNKISVREDAGSKIVENLINLKPSVTLDPTLLLSKQEWENLNLDNSQTNKYILVYLIAEDKKILNYARELKKRTGIEVIYISNRIYPANDFLNLRSVPVNKWLELILNADYILTNSFHGMAFSINFNKRFCAFLLPGRALVNSRIHQLIDFFELRRDVFEVSVDELIIQSINYIKINEKLYSARSNSESFLRDIVTN